MTSANVVLKNGAVIRVEGADSAEYIVDRRSFNPNDSGTIYRLACKQGEAVIGRFDSAEIAGYSLESPAPRSLVG